MTKKTVEDDADQAFLEYRIKHPSYYRLELAIQPLIRRAFIAGYLTGVKDYG